MTDVLEPKPRLRFGPQKQWVPAESWLDLLHLIYALRFPDREILASLTVRDGFSTFALKAALQDMCKRGVLDSSLRLAFTTRAEMGQSRKRVCYFIGPKAKEFLQLDPYVWNAKMNRVRGLRSRHENLAHERGITWIHAVLIAGERHGLWSAYVSRGRDTKMKTADGKLHTPDLVSTIHTFQDYVIAWEFERTNRYVTDANHRSPVRHAEFYWKAFQEGSFNGRVVFVTETFQKMVNLRQAIVARFQGTEVRNFFRFMSYETCSIADPAVLLNPDALITTADSPVWLAQPKRDTLTEPGLASR